MRIEDKKRWKIANTPFAAPADYEPDPRIKMPDMNDLFGTKKTNLEKLEAQIDEIDEKETIAFLTKKYYEEHGPENPETDIIMGTDERVADSQQIIQDAEGPQ